MGKNVDAKLAIKAARRGRCRDAFRYLHDAHPDNQTSDPVGRVSANKAYKAAQVIYDKLCTVNAKRGRRWTQPLSGARRGKIK